MRIKNREVYYGNYFRTGRTYAIVIPPDLREQMGVQQGDHFCMAYEHGILWMARVTKAMLFPRDKVSQIFDKMFPDNVEINGRK